MIKETANLCNPITLCVVGVSGPEYQEIEVHLLREKTGFGFRILGGDEAVQAVSPDARDKARMGRAGPHTYLTSYTRTSSYTHLTSSHISDPVTINTTDPHSPKKQARLVQEAPCANPPWYSHTVLTHLQRSTSHTDMMPC